jgi:hypothetical protein
MSWRRAQQKMIEELNTKIFFDDPCRKLREEYSSMDIENNNYIQELKNRKNSPERYDGSLIEKKKYNFLVTQGKVLDKIPGYVCRFDDGSYYAWNLKVLPEPDWREQMLPRNSHFGDSTFIPKMVGDLFLKDGKKLI